MLKTRILTAFGLAIFLIASIVFSTPVFVCVMALLALLAAWEWAGLAEIQTIHERVIYIATLIVVAGCLMLLLAPTVVIHAIVVLWILIFVWLVMYPIGSGCWQSGFLRGLLGWMILPAMWLAFVLIRIQDATGVLVLFLLAIVASADIGAYFFGHAFGRRKLAIAISPGKTLEGALGGILCAAIIGFIGGWFNRYSIHQALWCTLLGASVAFASIVGDLFESLLKRSSGVKDSGYLLPGHGGVLDRIDGWTAAAPVYVIFLMYTPVLRT